MNCSSCKDTFKELIIFNGNYYCEGCYSDKFLLCKNCKKVIENSFYATKRVCEECFFGKHIQYGSYTPKNFKFYNNNNEEDVYIGVELEIQGDKIREFSETIKDNEFFYCKRDGSIPIQGIEIVSHPATYQYHKSNQWKDIFDTLNYYDIKDISNCGLHFHIDRKSLAKKTIYNLDYIVNIFKNTLSEYGGRPYNYYCQSRYKNNFDWGVKGVNHFDAFNVKNKDTVEIRICKSTNNYRTFIKRLKFIYSLILFAQTVSNKEIFLIDENSFQIELKKIFDNHLSV
jgi:hypothetical protein